MDGYIIRIGTGKDGRWYRGLVHRGVVTFHLSFFNKWCQHWIVRASLSSFRVITICVVDDFKLYMSGYMWNDIDK